MQLEYTCNANDSLVYIHLFYCLLITHIILAKEVRCHVATADDSI